MIVFLILMENVPFEMPSVGQVCLPMTRPRSILLWSRRFA
jgi:hypothetical protein